jgi:prephenate dehydratase
MGVNARLKIGIQGEPGSYSAEAAAAMAPGADLLSYTTFEDVHVRLRDRTIDAAVLPFSNTLVGSIAEQYDLLLRYPAEIERELILRIEHQLIGLPGADLSTVREVFSHPVALQQCRRFFARRPQILSMPFYDTAGSVAYIMREGDPTLAAIASRQAAAHYGGQILQADVQDDRDNCTRFLLLRRPGEGVSSPDSLTCRKDA